MAVGQSTLTVEEFWEHYAGKPFELVNGEVIPVSPTDFSHGSVERRISSRLGEFVDQHQLGDVVGGEAGFWLAQNTMRGADVAFISASKLAQITEPQKYLPFAPDLAVEIVSPHDTASEIEEKVGLYLNAGTQLVWVLFPDLRKVVIYYPDGSRDSLTSDGILEGGDILPGFSVPVADLFPPEKLSTED